MAQQIGLFGTAPSVFVDDLTGKIAYYPAVLSAQESAELFTLLEQSPAWTQETMWMYDRTVAVPRLVARFEPEGIPPELAGVKARIEAFLGTAFNSLSAQRYRDERDSVAWHNDKTEELIERPVIALLSLGATRPMQLRSKERPRRAFAVDLEPGSVLVMSGRAQDFWEHHIPKQRRPTGPRISIALRQRTDRAPSRT